MISKVAVIGAGTMGNGIAHVFAQQGFEVNLVDISAPALEKALTTIGRNLDRLIVKERITEDDKANTLARITTMQEMDQALQDRHLIVEAATENLELKLKIFRSMDELSGTDAILATNTSLKTVAPQGRRCGSGSMHTTVHPLW